MSYTGYTDIAQFYDRVRASLKLENSNLSDAQVDYPEYAPLAERQIKRRVTGWADFTEADDITDFETAIVLQTAINCYKSFSNGDIKVKQTTNIKIEYGSSKDSSKKETSILDELIDRLNEILIILADEDDTDIFIGFVVTPAG